MKLKITQAAETSAETVFQAFLRFERYEQALAQYNVHLTRSHGWTKPALGVTWSGKAEIKGKPRRITAELVHLETDRGITLHARVGGLRLETDFDLVPLGRDLTRVNMTIDLKPDTLTARLAVQGLKLKRAKVLQSIQARLNKEVKWIETRASPAA